MVGIADLLLTLAYLVPVALIAMLLSPYSRRPRWLVVALLLGLPLFYTAHYLLLQRIQGWPSDAPLPEEFRLLAFRVTEPDVKRGEPGRILMWVAGMNDPEPRVHRLNYEKALHLELAAAAERQAAGRRQIGHNRAPGPVGLSAHPMRAGSSVSIRDQHRAPLPAKPAGD